MLKRTLYVSLAATVMLAALPVAMAQAPAPGRPSPQLPPVNPLIQDPGPIGAATTTALFAQVAVGGGWDTVFTFLNTGTDPVTGNLILTASDGTPMNVSVDTPTPTTGSSIPISIPAGGIQILTASPVNPADSTKTGWGMVESSGGQLGGVGTFQYFGGGGNLVTVAGVLSASPVTTATIPVDNDTGQNREVGYAVANVGTSPLTIKADVVDTSGAVQTSFNINLNAGAQVARFLFQDNGTFSTFKGSMVMIAEGTGSFVVVALVQEGSLYTVIPVVPAKAPGVN